MPIQIDNKGQFIALLARATSSPLPMQNTQDLSFVLTNAQNETATAIADYQFNLILIDIDLNWPSLVALAKTGGCINSHTPIIALVDRDDLNQRKQLTAAGFDACLLKPLTSNNLHEVISFWCKNGSLASFLESAQTLLTAFKANTCVVLSLYNKLFEELPQQITQIKLALGTEQYQLALYETHKINGSAKICYLKGIEESAQALEACLNQKKYDLADGYFLMLQHSINALITHRQAILNHLEFSSGKQ